MKYQNKKITIFPFITALSKIVFINFQQNKKVYYKMSKRASNSHKIALEPESTFRFDSKASCKGSKDKSVIQNIQQLELDLSQPTSEIMRYAEYGNQNILQLLEQSEEDKKTSKGEKMKRNDLWDFFARFQKQSNPDITISDIEFPHQKTNQNGRKRTSQTSQSNQKQQRKIKKEQNQQCQQPEPEDWNMKYNSRYPKRNRIGALRYWLGEKCVYKDGKIINVIRPKNQRDGNKQMI